MGNEAFHVGEIAIIHNCLGINAKFNGREVEIVGPIGGHLAYPDEQPIYADWMKAEIPHAKTFSIHTKNLRKRPQPPDWNALAMAGSKPLERILL